uniref:Uncharacterized protein n=1 Tax=Octopus bimaculoides TaxID=37653 RepID=A0A0L8I3T0_OCTBM
MVSYYGDQLQTFLDILNETGNKKLAKCISEKKNEFVFMIKSKQYLNPEGRQNHCSLLPRSIPTQFIYESNVEDVIDKVKEKYKCRKPIADRLYVVIVCKETNGDSIFYTDDDNILIRKFIEDIYDIFDKNEEIKIIAIVDANDEEKDRVKTEKDYLFTCSIAESTEMYIIEKKRNEDLKDFKYCENVMDLLKKIPDEKMNLYYNYIYIIMMQNSDRKIQKALNNKIKRIKIESKKMNKLQKVENFVQEIKPYLKPEMKKFIIFFVENYWKVEVALDYIKKLFTNLSDLKKEIDIVIRKTDKLTIPKNISVKKSDWDKTKYVSFYVMDEEKWVTILESSTEKQISVDGFLREYCSKIEYVEEK